MATNMPTSSTRPCCGRAVIDRIYKVGYPHVDGRRRTFEGYLDKVRHALTRAADRAAGGHVALRHRRHHQGHRQRGPDRRHARGPRHDHLGRHVEGQAPQDPRDPRRVDATRRSSATRSRSTRPATRSRCIDLQKRSTIDVATIERRGDTGGFVAPMPARGARSPSGASGYEIDVMTFLASLAGERLFFDGDNSAGVGGDLQQRHPHRHGDAGLRGHGAHRGVARRHQGAAGWRRSRPEDGTDRNLFETTFGRQVEAPAAGAARRDTERAHRRRTGGSCSPSPTRSRRTRRSPATTSTPSSGGRPGPTLDGWVYHTRTTSCCPTRRTT